MFDRFPELYSRLCQPIDTQTDITNTTNITDITNHSLKNHQTNTNNHNLQSGAEIILIPSAFTIPTGLAHWEILLRARAIENKVYVIAAAQSGQHNQSNRHSYGHTMIISPWGDILSECLSENENIIYTIFDKNKLIKIRNNIPIWKHKKYNCYK